MATATQKQTRGPRSVVGPDTWAAIQSSVGYRDTMVQNDEADKTHADKWIQDAEAFEAAASRLRDAAKHVYNGTKPINKPSATDLPEDPKELQKMVSTLQKQLSRLKNKNAKVA